MLLPLSLFGQQQTIYNHYFLNPFLYNPSYVAPEGYSELNLNFRKQWAGFSGAPTTGSVNLQLPINYKMGVALSGYMDQAGVLKTTTGLATFAYQVYLGSRVEEVHKIGFGISAGMTTSNIDPSKVDNPNDPVVGSTSSVDGQFGIHYQYKQLRIGFAIPKIFQTYVSSEQTFNKPGIRQVRNSIASISYAFPINQKLTFEPYLTYRTYENLNAQWEALGVLHIKGIGWAGGLYRQDYGAAAFVGFNVKERFKLSYAYEFAPAQASSLGAGSHELQLGMRLGKTKKGRKEAIAKNTTVPPTTTTPPTSREPAGDKTITPTQDTAPVQQDNRITSTPPESSADAPRPAQNTPPVTTDEKTEPAKTTTSTVKEKTATTTSQAPEANKDVSSSQQTTVKISPATENHDVKTLNGDKLMPGHYVVVGAFRDLHNAQKYANTLKGAGYPAHVAFHPGKGYYIVHMLNAATVDEAKQQRDTYRQMSRYSFRDTWILSID